MATLFPNGILFDGIVYQILPGGYAVIGQSDNVWAPGESLNDSLEAADYPRSDSSWTQTGCRHGCHPLLGQNRESGLYLHKRVPVFRFLTDSWALFAIGPRQEEELGVFDPTQSPPLAFSVTVPAHVTLGLLSAFETTFYVIPQQLHTFQQDIIMSALSGI